MLFMYFQKQQAFRAQQPFVFRIMGFGPDETFSGLWRFHVNGLSEQWRGTSSFTGHVLSGWVTKKCHYSARFRQFVFECGHFLWSYKRLCLRLCCGWTMHHLPVGLCFRAILVPCSFWWICIILVCVKRSETFTFTLQMVIWRQKDLLYLFLLPHTGVVRKVKSNVDMASFQKISATH